MICAVDDLDRDLLIDYLDRDPFVDYLDRDLFIDYLDRDPFVDYLDRDLLINYLDRDPFVDYLDRDLFEVCIISSERNFIALTAPKQQHPFASGLNRSPTTNTRTKVDGGYDLVLLLRRLH